MSATVKELLKSDSVCQSYAPIKKGPVFWLPVYYIAVMEMKASRIVQHNVMSRHSIQCTVRL